MPSAAAARVRVRRYLEKHLKHRIDTLEVKLPQLLAAGRLVNDHCFD
jgi:hypothetical protein